MIGRQFLLGIGLFDSRYSMCDDFDAWLKILMVAPIVHIPEVLAKYRMHKTNTSLAIDRLNDNKLLTALMMEILEDRAVCNPLAYYAKAC